MKTDRRKFIKNISKTATIAGIGFHVPPVSEVIKESEKKKIENENRSVEDVFKRPIFNEIAIGEIKPRGWLLNQLKIMRTGTTGHLDEVYDKVKIDNGWLGGKGDGWEETPYWLDGAVPLAYLLNDNELKNKVLKYINWTLDNQRPSGYFGPISKAERENGVQITVDNPQDGEDWWPKMVMLKVLRQYYSATEDSRVIPFMDKYFKYQYDTLKKCPIGTWTKWAESRGVENTMIVLWLYEIIGHPYLLELAKLIESQSFPWTNWFEGRDWVINAAAFQNNKDWMHRHGVNVGMALKAPIINYQMTGDKKYLNILKLVFNDLMTLHGLPHGMFSADEDLHGNNPIQGVELCAIVETMFSLEKAIQFTGDTQYLDALEKMTYNALPTQTTDDYNNKQYFQIANQVHICRGVFDFSLPFSREMNNVLGMRSGYTCCLANMHQGWTKFTQNLWYRSEDGGLAALSYAPNIITTTIGKTNNKITIEEETNYPFDDEVKFRISLDDKTNLPLYFRIPNWCQESSLLVNDKLFQGVISNGLLKIEREWNNNDTIILSLPMRVEVIDGGRNTRVIERGPLVYALKLGEKWEKGRDEVEGDYFSVYSKDDWNYGILKDVVGAPEENIQVRNLGVSKDFVWNIENAPIELKVSGKKIPGWKSIENGIAPTPVSDRGGTFRGTVAEKIEDLTLIPYGCTKVRVVAFPVVS